MGRWSGISRVALALLAVLLGGCAGEPPPPPPTATGGEAEEPGGETRPPPAPEHRPDEGATPAEPEGTGAAPGACAADEAHCCLADGTLVVPGGCQPMYPEAVRPATERGPDGRCVSIPCTLRCLPEMAAIATPEGEVAVSRLRVGALVYTRTEDGERVAVPVARVSSVPVIDAHTVVELTLDDGRRVRASAGHPLAPGGEVGALAPGDPLDGASVVSATPVPYAGTATWDLLPAGPTGVYWADGVPLGSTLGP